MAQIVSGARHVVQYVTCLAVSRGTSVLEGTVLQLTTTYKRSAKLSRAEGLSRVPETIQTGPKFRVLCTKINKNRTKRL